MKAFATILAKESTSAYVLKGGMVEHVMVRQPFIKVINFYYILIFLSYFDITRVAPYFSSIARLTVNLKVYYWIWPGTLSGWQASNRRSIIKLGIDRFLGTN